MTEREELAMVYALQKLKHYFFRAHFKMFTDHSMLKYLVNKLVLGGKICQLLLFFQDYDFEVIVKPKRLNVGLDLLLQLSTGEDPTSIKGNLPTHNYS